MSLTAFRRLALTAALAAPAWLSAQEAGIPVGNTAPNATLETLDGRPAQLSQWVGKMPVVLEFWAAGAATARRSSRRW